VGSIKSLGICFVLAALAFVAGCGGDSETTTVAGTETTVTTTVTAPAPSQPGQSEATPGPNQEPQGENSNRAFSPNPDDQVRPGSAAARRARFRQFAPNGGGPLFRCLKRFGAGGDGATPQSFGAFSGKKGAKLRKCLQGQFDQNR
jgi:hypothetical protein